MWVADQWKDYEVLDTSTGEKLERWGDYRLIRPDPQVIWKTRKSPAWKDVNGHYYRSSKGGGNWEFHQLPQEWMIRYTIGNAAKKLSKKHLPENPGNDHTAYLPTKQKVEKKEDLPASASQELHFMLKPFSFKHTGLFPEQAANWEWFTPIIQEVNRPVRVLNLFAYTGGATIAAAAAGAQVTHVDASKGMVTWAKENAVLSGLADAPIRWLVDDCTKFAEREIRRGNHYDAIILDPPSYGRGPRGEIWKMEDNIYDFLLLIAQLLSDCPLFVLLNSYTTGLQPAVLKYLLHEALDPVCKGYVEADEIGLPVTSTGLILPEGASGRWRPEH